MLLSLRWWWASRMTERCKRWERWLPGSGGMFKVLSWNLHSFRLLEIIQVLDSISWVRCASGNVFYFPHCGFSNDSSMHSAQSMHSHTGCICLSFLHCVFSNVSLNCRRDMMHKHIGCIRLIFLCPLSLSLKPDWLCVYCNLLVQNF